MDKRQAIRIITDCAKIYDKELCNQNVLFLFGTTNTPMCAEAKFDKQHFLHLTGVRKSRDITAQQFYERALTGRLGEKMFSIPSDGTVDLKLSVLAGLCRIHKNARMIGDYNNSKSLLITEKLVGGSNSCLGFIREDSFYIPNTALKEDIRDITYTPWYRIIATFRKPKKSPQYTELCYVAKGVEEGQLIIPEEYQDRVHLDRPEE